MQHVAHRRSDEVNENCIGCPRREAQDAEIERLRAAMSWLADHEPELVEQARQKFMLS